MKLIQKGQVKGQVLSTKARKSNSGGGTRTPDTRIMMASGTHAGSRQLQPTPLYRASVPTPLDRSQPPSFQLKGAGCGAGSPPLPGGNARRAV